MAAIETAKKKGKADEETEIARHTKKDKTDGVDTEIIAKYTGLSLNEINPQEDHWTFLVYLFLFINSVVILLYRSKSSQW